MKSIFKNAWPMAICFSIATNLFAQIAITRQGGADNIFILPECGAVLIEKEGTIKIQMMMPVDSRPKGYEAVDLKQNDIILMMNAKRIQSLDGLKEKYESMKTDEDIQFGIKRGEEMFIVSYAKIDPEKLPRQRTVIAQGKRDGGGQIMQHTVRIDAADGKIKPLVEVGLILKEENDQLQIDAVLPNVSEVIMDVQLSAGDVILSLGDTKTPNIETFSKIYDMIPVGSQITLGIKQGEQKLTVEFEKPEQNANQFIIKK